MICHGTLLAAHVAPESRVARDTLKDGVWLGSLVDLAGAHRRAVEEEDAQSLANLQVCEALLAGMISTYGFVLALDLRVPLQTMTLLQPLERELLGLEQKALRCWTGILIQILASRDSGAK